MPTSPDRRTPLDDALVDQMSEESMAGSDPPSTWAGDRGAATDLSPSGVRRADHPDQEDPMTRCDTCGNADEPTFTVHMASGHDFRFDSLECAAALIAPECGACGVRILGHGIAGPDETYCCAHCARRRGVEPVLERVAEEV